jgi:hypothetical protein
MGIPAPNDCIIEQEQARAAQTKDLCCVYLCTLECFTSWDGLVYIWS